MEERRHGGRPVARLFGFYAAISLVPVVGLGFLLARSYEGEAQRRGVAEGRAQAVLVARTGVEPQLDPSPLRAPLDPEQQARFRQLAERTMAGGAVLRMRIRGLDGRVIFSSDGSGFSADIDDEVRRAARGHVIALLTRVNADANDVGPRGQQAVEVYLPLESGSPARRVGVLEVYLPYEPIRQDIDAGLDDLYRNLALGLLALYVVGFVITLIVSRGLRRQVAVNAFLAEHDTLTGLPNRTLFHRLVARAVARSTTRRPVAVGLIDVDRFKEVNDTLGHRTGDRLLMELAQRLTAWTRRGDIVARLGGDEFGVLLHDATDVEGTLSHLRDTVADEIHLDGIPVSVEASIGYVVAPSDGRDVDELLQRGDVAMYAAKEHHSGVARYDVVDDRSDALNLELVAELRHAIDDELVLSYQPQFRTDGGQITGLEALVRWRHPAHGLLPPERFVPLAERTDLIHPLTTWVVTTALRDLGQLAPHVGGVTLSLNVSARNLVRPDFSREVVEAVQRADVGRERVVLEITETALLVDPARTAAVLAELDEAGIGISVDDFGRGYTSLGYLSALPVRELKIDGVFVADMLTDRAHHAIVRSIVDLGHNLGLRVVAEGVESEQILTALRRAGCDVVQGFALAAPMSLDELRVWLDRQQPLAARRRHA